MNQSILVITLPPLTGGVPDKAKLLSRHLRELGHQVTVSHYATYRDYPKLVVTLWQLFSGKKPKIQRGMCFDDFPCISVGCWLPEFEFTYYLMSTYWQNLINSHQRHIVVGGTVLTSNILTKLKIPHLVWCASNMIEDRIERRRSMSIFRRMLDQFVISPVQHFMEKRILTGNGRLMAVSSYTLKSLITAGGSSERISIVPIPVNLKNFQPPSIAPRQGVIGFAGRPEDPRKNLALLFYALRGLLKQNRNFELVLTGEVTKPLKRLLIQLKLSDRVTWTGWLKEIDLPKFYQKLDVFVIPSTQEGLNIAGLQAMASGIPIVSTRCGGPEDYVINEKTGTLVSFDAEEMATAIIQITEDREKRNEMGHNARQFVEEHYGHERFKATFCEAWQQTWGDKP
jgi:glycosyltransferase involved in cell wall biosynthesis